MIPDYKGKGIVNLMSTILNALGLRSPYPRLEFLNSNELKDSKNILLLLIDGFGINILNTLPKDNIFKRNQIATLTSIFPSTTASAITMFHTGLPPQQTAITGWFMNMKELGGVIAILPFTTKLGHKIRDLKIEKDKFLNIKTLLDKSNRTYFLYKKEIIEHDKREPRKLSYKNTRDMFQQLKRLIKNRRRKYIFAYWDKIDELSHKKGPYHSTIKRSALNLERELKKFLKQIKGFNTTIIITADHGEIPTPKEKWIIVNKDKELLKCLSLPLVGDSRVAHAFVRPSKVKEFKRIIKTKYKDKLALKSGEALIKENYFGLGKPNEKLYDRVGDYVLIAKENYAIVHALANKKPKILLGCHSGLSKEEMLVPLIRIKV